MQRRRLLELVAGPTLVGLAGCSGDGGSGGAGDGDDGTSDGGGSDGGSGTDGSEVTVGPDSSLRFEPETITVSTGTTVTWRFESAGHNVSAVPDHSDAVSLPDDAEPFASYDGDDKYAVITQGETFEHTFEVAGTYDYVCVPHAASGMDGTVRVE